MSQLHLPAPQPAMPPTGVTFHTTADDSILAVSHDLCRIAAFLQAQDPSARLVRADDWWEHDGLHFEKGPTDFHNLFQIVGTPRSLLYTMPGDHRVFVGIGHAEHSWYLRFLRIGTTKAKRCRENTR